MMRKVQSRLFGQLGSFFLLSNYEGMIKHLSGPGSKLKALIIHPARVK